VEGHDQLSTKGGTVSWYGIAHLTSVQGIVIPSTGVKMGWITELPSRPISIRPMAKSIEGGHPSEDWTYDTKKSSYCFGWKSLAGRQGKVDCIQLSIL